MSKQGGSAILRGLLVATSMLAIAWSLLLSEPFSQRRAPRDRIDPARSGQRHVQFPQCCISASVFFHLARGPTRRLAKDPWPSKLPAWPSGNPTAVANLATGTVQIANTYWLKPASSLPAEW